MAVRHVAVIDIGKTNAKVALVDLETQTEIALRRTPNTVLRDGPYPHYDIWLDEETNLLFGIVTRTDDHAMAALPLDPIMKRWWAHMRDLMESRPDNSPVDAPLTRVFHMD